MQGLPPEGYQPLPPHSLEGPSPKRVVDEESYSKLGSASTPLLPHYEGTIIVYQEGFKPLANPPFTNPLDPLLVRVNSSRNIILEDYPRLPFAPFEEVNMASGQSHANDIFLTLLGYMTPLILPTPMFNLYGKDPLDIIFFYD
jgi:hypothetical protein